MFNALKSFFTFHWLVDFFHSERWKQIERLADAIQPAVEAVSGIDWDGDGVVARSAAVDEISAFVATGAPILRMTPLGEYLHDDGTPDLPRLTAAAPSVLKRLLALARFLPVVGTLTFPGLSPSMFNTAIELALAAVKERAAKKAAEAEKP